jgi:hypothetical protein
MRIMAAKRRRSKKRRGLLLVMLDINPKHERELNRWYTEEHLAERLNCPGFLTARRFRAVEGKPKYLAIYDLDSPAVMRSAAYKKIRYASSWTRKMEPRFKNFVRNIYVEITPPLTRKKTPRRRTSTAAAR